MTVHGGKDGEMVCERCLYGMIDDACPEAMPETAVDSGRVPQIPRTGIAVLITSLHCTLTSFWPCIH